jgi:hypothetical protein
VRSTPARALREGQLVVDRYAVSKIGKIDYLPLNTITVQLINQLTGDEAERNLRWDQQVTTEEPFEVEIGDTGKIRVELAQLSDEEGRPAYRYRVTDETAGIDYEATDLRLDASNRPDNATAAKALLQFLGATSESFMVGHALEADLFPEDLNVWAANYDMEIMTARLGVSEGLGTDL